MLRIQLFASFQIIDDEKPLTRLQSDRLQALLAYLVLHRDQPQARQQLAVTFWPDTTDAQARTNLRTLLARLREVLPDADQFIAIEAQTVQWRSAASCTIDVIDFEETLTANRLADALTLPAPYLLKITVDTYIAQGDQAGLVQISIWTAATFIGLYIATRTEQYLLSLVGQRMLANIRRDLFEHRRNCR